MAEKPIRTEDARAHLRERLAKGPVTYSLTAYREDNRRLGWGLFPSELDYEYRLARHELWGFSIETGR